MINQCFSSEDFGPKRLIYGMSRKEQVLKAFGLTQKPTPKPKAPARMRRLATRITDKQRGQLAERRRKQSGVTSEQMQKMTARLGKKPMLDEIGSYYDKQKNKVYAASEGWRKWNETYYPKDSAEDAKEKIKIMQQAIFTRLDILGRPGADIDGKIGPFTLLAMAAIAKRERSGVATAAIEQNPNHKKVIEIVDATVLEPYAIVEDAISDGLEDSPEEKARKRKEQEEKERKRKKVARIESEIKEKEKEIYTKFSKVYRNYAEASKAKKAIENFDTKDFHDQQKEAEEKAKTAQEAIVDLKKEQKELEEKSDVVRHGREYVAKRRRDEVEKEIIELWKKMSGYRDEEQSLRNKIEAGLFRAETDLEKKLAQIKQTNLELEEKEGQARALKAEILELKANA